MNFYYAISIMNDYLNQVYFGNTLGQYLLSLGILVGGLILRKYISNFSSWILYRCFRRFGKTIGVKKFLELLSAPFGFILLIAVFYAAFNRLSFPPEWELVSENDFGLRFIILQLFEGIIIFAITWYLIRIIEFIGLVMAARAALTESKLDDQFVPFFKSALKIVVAGLGFIIMLSAVFNLNVVSILTGLGIGGLAFALAAKETLENLLGSFTIFLDKPFKIGDLVKVGEVEGYIEGIGFRSTRIRALDRTLVTVPNKKMVDYELMNDTEREVRRAKFTIGLTYSTSAEQLKKVMLEILDAVNAHPLTEPDPVVRFVEFGSSSLNILVLYLSRTPQIADFTKVKEEINFQIMEIVQSNDCEFAFPSSTVYLSKE
ncbi:MAG: mechanosensitive ion channel family protein [Bacteroidetes bacterium]|nr:MAG: mechanosensitive ion channel family protein [Bacteroidota bacterium]